MSGTSKVSVCIPTRGNPRAETMLWLMSIKGHKRVLNFHTSIGSLGIELQRNNMVKQFFESSEATHLFFLDDDVAPPGNVDVIERLLHADKDIVTAMVPLYQKGRIGPSAYTLLYPDLDLDDYDSLDRPLFRQLPHKPKGLDLIDGCGAACMLIRKEVFIRTPFPWYEIINFDAEDHRLGEDLYFCLNARRAGFSVWIDWSIKCVHYKTIPLEIL